MNLKNEFPIFIANPHLVYLDSAATSQKPGTVIKTLKDFYTEENAAVHRGVYKLSESATEKYESSREKVSQFINSQEKEIVFTKSATEGFNLIANSIKELIKPEKNEIVLTEMEHHSNLIPWQELAKSKNMKLKFIPFKENFELDYEKAEKIIGEKTAIISFTHVSNVFGTENNVKKLIDLAKKAEALTIIDAAQSVSHLKIDVKKLDCDFLIFSSHKMLGPNGVGVVYGKYDLLEKLKPLNFGGGMIDNVSFENSSYAKPPIKFEAGSSDVASVISLKNAVDYLEGIGFDKIAERDSELISYCINKLNELEFVKIYSHPNSKGIISFQIKNVHSHDVAQILSDNGICIRAGHHCCMPLMKKLGVTGLCRASFSVYNDKEDVDKLIDGLKKVKEVFI